MTKKQCNLMQTLFFAIEEVNPAEIAEQIKSDNLTQWCIAWKVNMRMHMDSLKKTMLDKD